MRRNKSLRNRIRRQNNRLGIMVAQKPLRSLVLTTLISSMATGITVGLLLNKNK